MKTTKKLLSVLCLAATQLTAQHGVLDNTFGTNGAESYTGMIKALAPNATGGYSIAANNAIAYEHEVMAGSGPTAYFNYYYRPLETIPNPSVGNYNFASSLAAAFYTYTASDIAVRPDAAVITLVNRKQYQRTPGNTSLETYGQGEFYIHSSAGTSVSSSSLFAQGSSTDNLVAHSIYALPDNKMWIVTSVKDPQNNQQGQVHTLLNADFTLNMSEAVPFSVVPTTDFHSNGILKQPDNKLLFMIHNSNFTVMRRLSTGQRDSTFGTNGTVGTTVTGASTSMALQADGKIVQLGYSNTDSLMLVRYTSAGIADNTFGAAGVLNIRPVGFTAGAGTLEAGCTEAQADGKLLISAFFRDATTVSNSKLLLIRLNTNGTFDNTFGTNGVLQLAVPATFLTASPAAYLNDIDIASDGKIYMSASLQINPNTARTTNIPSPQGDKTLNIYSRVYRVISNMVVTAVDLVQSQPEAMIYPNPVAENFTLSYELSQNSDVNLSLMDMQGRTLHTFPAQTAQVAGKYSQQYNLPQGLSAGNYILRLQTQQGQAAIQIMIP